VDLDLRDRAHSHDRVAVEVLGDDLAAVAEHDLAPRGRAEPEQEPAFDLGANQIRVERDAAVEREHDPIDVDALAVIERDLGHVGAGQRAEPAGAVARAARSPRPRGGVLAGCW
jgi:hypothetical protein